MKSTTLVFNNCSRSDNKPIEMRSIQLEVFARCPRNWAWTRKTDQWLIMVTRLTKSTSQSLWCFHMKMIWNSTRHQTTCAWIRAGRSVRTTLTHNPKLPLRDRDRNKIWITPLSPWEDVLPSNEFKSKRAETWALELPIAFKMTSAAKKEERTTSSQGRRSTWIQTGFTTPPTLCPERSKQVTNLELAEAV